MEAPQLHLCEQFVRCPNDHSKLDWSATRAYCPDCRAEYPIEDGIPDFVALSDRTADGQAQMDEALSALEKEQQAWTPLRSWCHDFGLAAIARAHRDLLAPYLLEAVYLDNGCGRGSLLESAMRTAVACFGLDAHRASLSCLKGSVGSCRPVVLVRGSALRLPFEDNTFDVISSSEVLEHVVDPAAYLEEIWRTLRPGGVCTLSTPNGWMHLFPFPWNLKLLLTNRAAYIRLLKPEQRWAESLPSHPALRPSVLRQWCRQTGFEVLKHRGVLWYYWTPWRPTVRMFLLLERLRFPAVKAFSTIILPLEKLLQYGIPVFNCFASRQIVLLRKPPPYGTRQSRGDECQDIRKQ